MRLTMYLLVNGSNLSAVHKAELLYISTLCLVERYRFVTDRVDVSFNSSLAGHMRHGILPCVCERLCRLGPSRVLV